MTYEKPMFTTDLGNLYNRNIFKTSLYIYIFQDEKCRFIAIYLYLWSEHRNTHLWPFSKSKLNLKSDRVNLVAPASPIECLLYLPNIRAIQYKLGPERLTRLGNSNVLPMRCLFFIKFFRFVSLILLHFYLVQK